MTGWYDRAFGPWYLRLYPHRTTEEAARALAAVDAWLPSSGPLLDVGCGAGRHLELLVEHGREAVGLDRSATLLGRAAHRPRLRSRLVRGDMRHLPFAGDTWSGVLSMFTSFGYFGTRPAHVALLTEFARVTRPDGVFILDYLNAEAVRRGLVPASERTVDVYRIRETRAIVAGEDGDLVVKEVVVADDDGVELDRYHEEVALYDRGEIIELLQAGGWRPGPSLGDYDGGAWTPDSPRLLLCARRAA